MPLSGKSSTESNEWPVGLSLRVAGRFFLSNGHHALKPVRLCCFVINTIVPTGEYLAWSAWTSVRASVTWIQVVAIRERPITWRKANTLPPLSCYRLQAAAAFGGVRSANY